MTTQSIIVYRNPGEEALWNLLSHWVVIPIAAGILMAVLTYAAVHMGLSSVPKNYRIKYNAKDRLALFLSLAVGVVTGWFMWL